MDRVIAACEPRGKRGKYEFSFAQPHATTFGRHGSFGRTTLLDRWGSEAGLYRDEDIGEMT
jgi:hypothetical protein